MAACAVIYSAMILSRQNSGINLSSLRMRQMIDRIGEQARYSLEQPVLINADGTSASGSQADGMLLKRYGGGPYILKESGGTNGDIAATAKTFRLEFRKDLPTPGVGDYIMVEAATAPELEITAASKVEENSSVQRWSITTKTAVGELLRPSTYRVAAQIYRKEAFVFKAIEAGNNPRSELRHYKSVVGTTNFSQASNYRVLASGFRKLGNNGYFRNVTSNNLRTTVLSAVVHATGRDQYLDSMLKTKSYTTMPVELRLWAISQ